MLTSMPTRDLPRYLTFFLQVPAPSTRMHRNVPYERIGAGTAVSAHSPPKSLEINLESSRAGLNVPWELSEMMAKSKETSTDKSNACRTDMSRISFELGNPSGDPMASWVTSNDDPWDPFPKNLPLPRIVGSKVPKASTNHSNIEHGSYLLHNCFDRLEVGSTHDSGYATAEQSVSNQSVRSGVFRSVSSSYQNTLSRIPVPHHGNQVSYQKTDNQLRKYLQTPSTAQGAKWYCQECQQDFRTNPEFK